MGRTLLVWRVVRGSIRRRPVMAALSVIAIATAVTTLTMALALYGVTGHPYAVTQSITRGPDIVAFGDNPGNSGLSAVTPLENAPGVVAHGGPYPVGLPRMEANGQTVLAIAEGRSTAPASIDQPYVTNGTWLTDGGVVVERAFADELGLKVGERVTLAGRSFRVVGLAVDAALPAYPNTTDSPVPISPWQCSCGAASDDTGLVWMTESNLDSLAAATSQALYPMLDLKLADPSQAVAFDGSSGNNQSLSLQSWINNMKFDGQLTGSIQRALLVVSWLFGLLAIASLAVLVGGRIAESTRRVGLLKAVGATPRLVAVVQLVEYLVLAIAAAALGLLAGWLAAPLISNPGGGLVGSAGVPSVTPATFGWAALLAVVVAVAAAFVPAVRAARTSTTDALADAAHTPKRKASLVRLAARMPVSLLIGLRLAARRPRRMLLGAFSLAVTVTTLVAVLEVHAHENAAPHNAFGVYSHLVNPRTAKVDEVLLVMTVVLIVLACVNALVITWVTYVDSQRPLAVARALGATPRQVSSGLSAALLMPAVPGALAGVPLGLLLVKALSDGSSVTIPSVWWLVVAVFGTLAVLTALSILPARAGSRRSVVEALQVELA